MTSKVDQIDILYMRAGSGHISAARALEATLKIKWPEIKVNLIDIRDVLDSVDILKKYTGLEFESIYNWQIKRGITRGLRPQLKIGQSLIKFYGSNLYSKLYEYYLNHKTNVIVSVIPNFNKIIARVAEDLSVPFITVMADLADSPPDFWMEPESKNQMIVCDMTTAVPQALQMNIPVTRIMPVRGTMVHPKFYQEHLKCDYHKYHGLVVYGGYGSKRMLDIAKMNIPSDIHMIYVCGNNPSLREKISSLTISCDRTVVGFTDLLPLMMHQSDFVIGKPGPGIINECVVSQVPFITENRTMFQEAENLNWIRKHKIGYVLESFNDLLDGIDGVLRNQLLFKQNLATIKNNTVFEVADYLAKTC